VQALRMEAVYAAPGEGEAMWYGVASEAGELAFETSPDVTRYLLIGFPEEAVLILDVTDALRPRFLYGYGWLQVEGQAGIYLGYEGDPAKLLAVGDSAVVEVEQVSVP